jgi:hypothetical protein
MHRISASGGLACASSTLGGAPWWLKTAPRLARRSKDRLIVRAPAEKPTSACREGAILRHGVPARGRKCGMPLRLGGENAASTTADMSEMRHRIRPCGRKPGSGGEVSEHRKSHPRCRFRHSEVCAEGQWDRILSPKRAPALPIPSQDAPKLPARRPLRVRRRDCGIIPSATALARPARLFLTLLMSS